MNHRATSGLCVLEGTLQVWHALCVWSVSVWTDNPRLCRPLSSPWLPHLSDYSGCTMHFGSPPLLLARRKCCGDEPFAQVWGGEKNLTTTFGITVTLVCQEYTNMQTQRKLFTLLCIWTVNMSTSWFLFQIIVWFKSPIVRLCVSTMNS